MLRSTPARTTAETAGGRFDTMDGSGRSAQGAPVLEAFLVTAGLPSKVK